MPSLNLYRSKSHLQFRNKLENSLNFDIQNKKNNKNFNSVTDINQWKNFQSNEPRLNIGKTKLKNIKKFFIFFKNTNKKFFLKLI